MTNGSYVDAGISCFLAFEKLVKAKAGIAGSEMGKSNKKFVMGKSNSQKSNLKGASADFKIAAATLDDARELFSDVPPEKSAHNQAVLGWKGPGGLYAIAAILRDYPRDGTWYLGFMIVDAAQRGRGVGRSIYSTVESWAAARGATEIRLAVLEANEAAERFWRSLGFIEYRRVGPDTFKMRSHRRIELSRRLSGATVEGSNK